MLLMAKNNRLTLGPQAYTFSRADRIPCLFTLGKAVVTNAAVPDDVRQRLNVDNGLNDGTCVPILFVFLDLAREVVSGAEPWNLALGLVAEELCLPSAKCWPTSFRRDLLTADKLHDALAGYMMLALLWGLFLRHTTLTTTGFVNIAPVSDGVRWFVIIEEFAGVLFVGVLIARLAGIYLPVKL
jgi:hypothetical protein